MLTVLKMWQNEVTCYPDVNIRNDSWVNFLNFFYGNGVFWKKVAGLRNENVLGIIVAIHFITLCLFYRKLLKNLEII